jgi:hypothetical protein
MLTIHTWLAQFTLLIFDIIGINRQVATPATCPARTISAGSAGGARGNAKSSLNRQENQLGVF